MNEPIEQYVERAAALGIDPTVARKEAQSLQALLGTPAARRPSLKLPRHVTDVLIPKRKGTNP